MSATHVPVPVLLLTLAAIAAAQDKARSSGPVCGGRFDELQWDSPLSASSFAYSAFASLSM